MKKKIDLNHRRAQRGVALLFALGILSLLLILGLASVTNALLAQKVASNNSGRSQAKMMAQSAISRMAISLMYYQYEASHAPSPFIPDSYMDIYSFYDLPKGGTPVTTDLAATDGLRYEDSKLIPPGGLTNYDYGFTSTHPEGENLLGQWSYVTDTDADGNKRIVGRVAYQLLPTSQSAQINLDHVLHGVYSQGTPARVPWTDRWGTGINELNLNETTVFKNWESDAPASSADLTASTFDAFFSAYSGSLFSGSDASKKKAWVRRWFAEGTVAADPEYYRYYDSGDKKSYYYHRFPLGTLDSSRDTGSGFDAWYERLTAGYSPASVNPNSEAIVGRLANSSVEFKITDSLTAEKVGLPFLKYLSKDQGSFSDITSRRKQIAANLNDYCDSDSIPTSNVEASTWSSILSTTGSWPKYTGNEKTPYINEFALMFNVVPEIVNPNSSNMQIKLTLTPTVLAELIDIYEPKPSDAYKLLLNLKNFTVEVEIMGKGDWSIPGTPPTTGTFDKTEKKVFTFTFPSTPLEIDFPETSWGTDIGYALAGTALAPVSQAVDFEQLSSNAGITSVTGVHTSFKIVKATFDIQGMALLDSTGSGVDFSCWNQTIETGGTFDLSSPKMLFDKKATTSAGEFTLADSGTSFGLDPRDEKLFIAGMQAKDPRQNLNVSTTATSNDWSDLAKINWVEYDPAMATSDPAGYTASGSNALLTMKLKLNETVLANILELGLVNKEGNPNTKVSGGTGSYDANHDVETVTDPAWVVKSGGTTEHLSTAFIRNAPMYSPWELGAIHRGAAWETINLKNAMSPLSATEPVTPEDMGQFSTGNGWNGTDGTTYAGGDGGILEQIKMTDKAYCYGKLNVNMLSSSTAVNPDYTSWDDEMGRSLFFNLRYGQNLADLSTLPSSGGTKIVWSDTATVVDPLKGAVTDFRGTYGSSYKSAFENRAQFLCWRKSSNSLANGAGIIPAATWAELPDAQQEELVGKTIDLIKTNNSITNTIKFIVVAQAIRDVGDSSSGGIPVVRIDYKGDPVPKNCKLGVFDVDTDGSAPTDALQDDKYLHYDQITGEVKMLVTMENNPTKGQTIIRQVEYIE